MKLHPTLLLASLALLSSSVKGHICLTYPMMRGKHPDLFPGDPTCFHTTPDCGDLPKGAPTATFIAGVSNIVTFQQNLNHFWDSDPGFFDLAVSYDDKKTWTQVGYNVSDWPARNQNFQTYFNVPVVLTNASDSAVIRLRYMPNNPSEPATFYSCSDVKVVARGDWPNPGVNQQRKQVVTLPDLGSSSGFPAIQKLDRKKQRAVVPSSSLSSSLSPSTTSTFSGNCEPPSDGAFIASGIEYSVSGTPIPLLQHKIWYDPHGHSAVKWLRSDLGLGGTFSMTDYWNTTWSPSGGDTSQYIVGLNGQGTCTLYPGDKFFSWKFGPQINQRWVANVTSENNDVIMIYEMESNGFSFEAVVPEGGKAPYCFPRSWGQVGGSRVELGDLERVESIPSSEFEIPSICKNTRSFGGCHGADRRFKQHQK